MCHILEFQNILDSDYIRIGLPVYVKFALGKWISSPQKLFKSYRKMEEKKKEKRKNYRSPNKLSLYHRTEHPSGRFELQKEILRSSYATCTLVARCTAR